MCIENFKNYIHLRLLSLVRFLGEVFFVPKRKVDSKWKQDNCKLDMFR